jgi:glycogen synthase
VPLLQVGYTVPGFSHNASAADHRQNVHQLLAVLQKAVAEFGSSRYRTLQQNCMALDVSWERPAEEWESLLCQVIHDRVQAAFC